MELGESLWPAMLGGRRAKVCAIPFLFVLKQAAWIAPSSRTAAL
jgi:hypothetical protein